MSSHRTTLLAAITCFLVSVCCYIFVQSDIPAVSEVHLFKKCTPEVPTSLPTIFVITPTASSRLEQKADLTRLSQTLQLVEKMHWIVVEDSENKTDRTIDVLNASGLSYTHLAVPSNSGNQLKKGFEQRNAGLSYLHQKYGNGSNVSGVVYFADDDNSYDLRLFNNYIRHVKRVGVWAVGLSGAQKVESPFVVDGRVVGWNVSYAPGRKFATDMAGFAVNLHTILTTEASFKKDCPSGLGETCFLEQFNVSLDQLEPFGFDTEPKKVFVWHTKTGHDESGGDTKGYIV